MLRQCSVRVILKTIKEQLMGVSSRVESYFCVNWLVRLDSCDVCKRRSNVSYILSDFIMVKKYQLALSI